MVNVFTLEERLSNQPLVAECRCPVDARSAVVAVLAECKGRGQNVEVVATECQSDGGRRIAGVVASDAVAGLHRLDAGLLEQCLDLRSGPENDSRAGICDDGGAGADRPTIHCDIAGDDPLVAD